MIPESSPFRPGQPVPSEFFTGRSSEIERLRSMVNASTRGRFRIGFVSGERGIGKSSLAAFVRRLVEQEQDVVGCHVFLGGVQSLGKMLCLAFDRLLKESMDEPWHQKLRSFFGSHVREVGLFGVTFELSLQDKDMSVMEHDFVPSIRRLVETLKEHKKSLFLILDDIRGLTGSKDFANWLKSSVDEIAVSAQETRLCILMIGLEDRRRELVESQPSLDRVFELIDIVPWSDEEVFEFYRNSFRAGNAQVSEEDIRTLVRFAGGLPILAHEIGDAVWRTARNLEVKTDEIAKGIAMAAEVIGRKFLEPRIFRAIRSGRYRSILRKIEDGPRMRFRRTELQKGLTSKEKNVLDHFLLRMRELGVLEMDPEIQGEYRFLDRLYALYFWMETQRELT